MAWLPITFEQLRIGLFIKLDYNWLGHPFVRNTFTISFPSEIAIIRKKQLTKLYYDPDRSNADPQAGLRGPASEELTAEMIQDIQEDEKSFERRKASQAQAVRSYHTAQENGERKFADQMKRCTETVDMMIAGQAEGMRVAAQIIGSMMNDLGQPSLSLSLVAPQAVDDPKQKLAAEALRSSILVLQAGASLNLSQAEAQHLGLGAFFHNIGMFTLPPSVWQMPASAPSEQFQQYPLLGKQLLEAVPGVAPEIIQIVYQHQECLDGSGYPTGLASGELGPLPRLVGMIAKYNELIRSRSTDDSMSPAQALSQLYANMQNKFGLDVMEPVIAAMTVYPPGSFVELSDGSFGLVVQVNAQARMLPVVGVYAPDTLYKDSLIVDLAKDGMLFIRDSLSIKSVPPEVASALSAGQMSGYMLLPAMP